MRLTEKGALQSGSGISKRPWVLPCPGPGGRRAAAARAPQKAARAAVNQPVGQSPHRIQGHGRSSGTGKIVQGSRGRAGQEHPHQPNDEGSGTMGQARHGGGQGHRTHTGGTGQCTAAGLVRRRHELAGTSVRRGQEEGKKMGYGEEHRFCPEMLLWNGIRN